MIKMLSILQKERDYFEEELKKERKHKEELQVECDVLRQQISDAKASISDYNNQIHGMDETIRMLRQDRMAFEEEISQKIAQNEMEKKGLLEEQRIKEKSIRE
jgi:chromosome segregation ATPase